jgi:hypothetical protein
MTDNNKMGQGDPNKKPGVGTEKQVGNTGIGNQDQKNLNKNPNQKMPDDAGARQPSSNPNKLDTDKDRKVGQGNVGQGNVGQGNFGQGQQGTKIDRDDQK